MKKKKNKYEEDITKKENPLAVYAYELQQALIQKGIPKDHAQDCANNSAMPLAMFPNMDVCVQISKRLHQQKDNFGLKCDDATIAFAALNCVNIRRPKI